MADTAGIFDFVPDPLADAVYEGDQFLPVDRAMHGLGEGTNNADVVDRLRHPSYQQLHDDKDLRRGKTRMVPRDDGVPPIKAKEWPRDLHGIPMRERFQQGGPVRDPTDPSHNPLEEVDFGEDDYPSIYEDYPRYRPTDPLADQVDRGERRYRSEKFRHDMAFDMGPKGTPGRAEEQGRRRGSDPEQEYEELADRDRAREKLRKFHEEYDRRNPQPNMPSRQQEYGGYYQQGGPVHNPNDPKQIIANITQKYPKLGGYDWSIVDSRGNPDANNPAGGQLEFYHADDPSSPTPGKPTIEVFNEKLQGPALEKAIFGDMLHHLPEVDQNWRRMRTNYLSSLTPEQKSIDQQAYQRDQKSYGENREYDDWMEGSRLDAHIRGRLAPDEQDNWRDSYTGQQHEYLDEMEDYLTNSGQLRQYQEGGSVLPDGTQMADKGDVRRLNEFGPRSVEEFLEQSPGFSPDDEFESLGFDEVQPYDFFVPQPNKEKQPNDGKPGEYWRRREPPPTSRAPASVQQARKGGSVIAQSRSPKAAQLFERIRR